VDEKPVSRRKRQGNRLFQCGVGPTRFERRPTIRKRRELMVDRRGEAPLVPPDILPSFKKALDLSQTGTWTRIARKTRLIEQSKRPFS